MIKNIFLAVACVSMTGCSVLAIGESEYACKGYDTKGVTCMSAREVYHATENATSISNSDFKNEEHEAEASGRNAQRQPSGAHQHGQPTTQQHRAAGQYIQHKGPTPIRTPARVMRVWVDTYEDKQGDLHSPGLVYTEVESRRWNIGNQAPRRAEKITPLGLKSSNMQRQQNQPPQQPGKQNGTKNLNQAVPSAN
jgi:conjugal transfer pilus assembly protein TraV